MSHNVDGVVEFLKGNGGNVLRSGEDYIEAYFREGSDRSGAALHENDDLESGNTNSRIQESLAADSYTVEATTYDEGQRRTASP